MKYIFLIFIFTHFLSAQYVTIKGQVSSKELKEPLEGVNIYLQNSTIGTVSSRDGYYELNRIPSSDITLIVSHVGFAQKKLSFYIDKDTTINISLSQKILDGPIVSSVATQANQRESAITFSNLPKKEITKRYDTQDIPEILSDLPSTTFYSENGNGIGYNYLSIRGFDQRRISVMINGIPQNDPEDHNIYWLDFPDLTTNIQSFQVQRGAGNAFYGPAAIGGSINITTDHFSPEQKITASFGYGSFNTKKSMFSVNSGLLGDEYILYGRISNIKSDGYRDHSWVNFWSYFLGAARYDTHSNLRIHFYGGPIEDGLAYGGSWNQTEAFGGIPRFLNDDDNLRKKNWGYFSIDPQADTLTYTVDRRKDEIENFNQPHLEILHEWQIDNQMILNNNFFYTKGYGFFDYDGSWGWDDYFRLTPGTDYDNTLVSTPYDDVLIRAYVDNDQYGWLPQLTIKTEKGDMILGAELRRHRSLHWGRIQKADSLNSSVVGSGAHRYYEYKGGKDIFSVYFHQNYEWYENIILQADLQYTHKEYRLFDEKYIGIDFTVPYNFVNPRIGINYNITQSSNIYLNMYSTTREPRLKNLYDAAEATDSETPQFETNSDGSYNFDKPLVKPEILNGVDFGYSFSESQYSGSLNFYYMNFSDEIIKSGGVDRFGQPRTGNADKTLHYGAELSGRITPFTHIAIEGNIALSNNEIKRFKYYETDSLVFSNNGLEFETQINGNDTTFVTNLKGNPIAGFPSLLANARITYSWQDLYLTLAAKYVGESYTDNLKNKNHKVDAYTIFNLAANYNLKHLGLSMLTLQGRVNNLLDKKYLAYGEGIAFFPAAGRNYFLTLKYEL